MSRQQVFGIVLGLTLATSVSTAIEAIQSTSTNVSPTSPRPPADIPLSRLSPDAIIALTLEPGAVASDDGVWVPAPADGTLVRINAKDNKPAPTVSVGRGPCASLAVAFDSVWVPLCGDRSIARVDPKVQKVIVTLSLVPADADGRLATSVGSLWVLTDRKGVLARIDPASNLPVAEIYVGSGASSVAAGEDALWITSETANRLTRVNPHTNETIETIEVGPKPGRLAVGEGGVWTLNRGDGSVTRVNPATNKVVATIPLGEVMAKGEIAAGAGSVWISAPGVPIVRIDPRTNRAIHKFTGDGGGAILVAHGSVWVAARPGVTWRLDPLLVAAVRP